MEGDGKRCRGAEADEGERAAAETEKGRQPSSYKIIIINAGCLAGGTQRWVFSHKLEEYNEWRFSHDHIKDHIHKAFSISRMFTLTKLCKNHYSILFINA